MGTKRFEELVKDIKEHGQVTPVILKRVKEHRYKIIDGALRIDALRKIGVTTVLAYVDSEGGIVEVPVIQISK